METQRFANIDDCQYWGKFKLYDDKLVWGNYIMSLTFLLNLVNLIRYYTSWCLSDWETSTVY